MVGSRSAVLNSTALLQCVRHNPILSAVIVFVFRRERLPTLDPP